MILDGGELNIFTAPLALHVVLCDFVVRHGDSLPFRRASSSFSSLLSTQQTLPEKAENIRMHRNTGVDKVQSTKYKVHDCTSKYLHVHVIVHCRIRQVIFSSTRENRENFRCVANIGRQSSVNVCVRARVRACVRMCV